MKTELQKLKSEHRALAKARKKEVRKWNTENQSRNASYKRAQRLAEREWRAGQTRFLRKTAALETRIATLTAREAK